MIRLAIILLPLTIIITLIIESANGSNTMLTYFFGSTREHKRTLVNAHSVSLFHFPIGFHLLFLFLDEYLAFFSLYYSHAFSPIKMSTVLPRRMAASLLLLNTNFIIINNVSLLPPTESNHNTILNKIQHDRWIKKTRNKENSCSCSQMCSHV